MAVLLFSGAGVFAADGTWQPGSGSGNWNDSGEWASGIIGDGIGSTVTLRNPTSGGNYTITLQSGETRTVGNIVWGANASRSYAIAGPGTLTFDTGTTDAPVITLSAVAAAAGTRGTLSSNVSGTKGIRIQGNDPAVRFWWDPGTMGLTGGIAVAGISLQVSDGAKLGSNKITLAESNDNGGRVILAAPTTLANAIELANDKSGLSSNYNQSSLVQDVNVQGVISESGGPRAMAYQTDLTSAQNGKVRYVVSGANTYSGNTVIGGAGDATGVVIVRATHSGALGSGTDASISFTGSNKALELSGGVTLGGKTITLNGLGYDNLGSLRSVSGNNVWSGGVATGTAGEGRIRVDADRLVIEGVISGDQAFSKTGDGVLELTGANSYTSATTVHAGTLLLSHDEALGGGTVQVRPAGTLHVNTGIQAQAGNLELINNANLAFTLSGLVTQTGLVVSGNQSNGGEAGNAYDVFIYDAGIVSQSYTLMTVAGSYDAAAIFNLHMAAGFEGSTLEWTDGNLTLNVIPEVSTSLLLGVGFGLFVLLGVRRPRRSKRPSGPGAQLTGQ